MMHEPWDFQEAVASVPFGADAAWTYRVLWLLSLCPFVTFKYQDDLLLEYLGR